MTPTTAVERGLTRSGICLVAVVVVDQTTKYVASRLAIGDWNEPGLNHGLSLGLDPNVGLPPLLFAALGVLALLAVSLRVATTHPERLWAAALALGGALSNFLDRLLHSAVIDFLPLGPIVLNLADVAVVFGLGALALSHHRAPVSRLRRSDERR